jgi:putative transposase
MAQRSAMARPLRIQYPGACYPVMSRGNSRQDIFITDGDRKAFLDAPGDSAQIYNVMIICYVLMSDTFTLSSRPTGRICQNS